MRGDSAPHKWVIGGCGQAVTIAANTTTTAAIAEYICLGTGPEDEEEAEELLPVCARYTMLAGHCRRTCGGGRTVAVIRR